MGVTALRAPEELCELKELTQTCQVVLYTLVGTMCAGSANVDCLIMHCLSPPSSILTDIVLGLRSEKPHIL